MVKVRMYRVRWCPYFKMWQLRFRSECPRCFSWNKHGVGYSKFPEQIKFQVSRGCDHCGKDYDIVV